MGFTVLVENEFKLILSFLLEKFVITIIITNI